MKIEFLRSGGFAAPALGQTVEIDTDDLPQHEAKEVVDLVRSAGIETVAPAAAASPAPDAFHYRIKVSDADVSHTATVSDADMPESLNKLIGWLTSHASQKS
jgi:hypothetical protein